MTKYVAKVQRIKIEEVFLEFEEKRVPINMEQVRDANDENNLNKPTVHDIREYARKTAANDNDKDFKWKKTEIKVAYVQEIEEEL